VPLERVMSPIPSDACKPMKARKSPIPPDIANLIELGRDFTAHALKPDGKKEKDDPFEDNGGGSSLVAH